MNKAVVIIPTTGSNELLQSVESVVSQSMPTTCYVVVDGKEHEGRVRELVTETNSVKICVLPSNVGADGYYGHRVYAAFAHLVNEGYVLFLDQDNWLDPNHVESCVQTIEQNGLQWCHSLRKICSKDGTFVCNDDCESLGRFKKWVDYNHVDTNAYCIKKEVLVRVAAAWHGGWGQDRVFLNTLAQHFPQFKGTGQYTVNYRLAGNEGSVSSEFFVAGNKAMSEFYPNGFPWVVDI